MGKIAYFDCPTGIAGDMCLGALVDAGVPFEALASALDRLGLGSAFSLRAESVARQQQRATKVWVDLAPTPEISPADDLGDCPSGMHRDRPPQTTHSHGDRAAQNPAQPVARPHDRPHAPHRHLPDIEAIVRGAGLPARAEAWSLAVFRRLAEAEGAVHGIPPERVHFHEVGAADAIADIVGTCWGLDWLDPDAIYCSPLPTGGGTVRAAHGRLPVPVPAVLKLWELRQVPIYSNGIDRELVTPTGAALVTVLADGFGAPPPMALQRVGLGAGSLDLPLPNLLRLWIGTANGDASGRSRSRQIAAAAMPSTAGDRAGSAPMAADNPAIAPPEGALETVTVLETQIDDLSPQAVAYALEETLAAGALDAFSQPAGMKKSRPGTLLTVICPPERVDACEAVLFRETTTLGIRRSRQQRRVLQRDWDAVDTAFGPVRVKVAWAAGGDRAVPLNVQPEYEDVAARARDCGASWHAVRWQAIAAWQARQGKSD